MIKATVIWPYIGEVLFFQEKFCHFETSVGHLINYIIKTILSDAESCEKHKYIYPRGTQDRGIMGFFMPGCR